MKKLPLTERSEETPEEGVPSGQAGVVTQGLSVLRSERVAPSHSWTPGSAMRGDVQERKPSADTRSNNEEGEQWGVVRALRDALRGGGGSPQQPPRVLTPDSCHRLGKL